MECPGNAYIHVLQCTIGKCRFARATPAGVLHLAGQPAAAWGQWRGCRTLTLHNQQIACFAGLHSHSWSWDMCSCACICGFCRGDVDWSALASLADLLRPNSAGQHGVSIKGGRQLNRHSGGQCTDPDQQPRRLPPPGGPAPGRADDQLCRSQ